MVVPVGPPFNDYAKQVRDVLKERGFCAEADVDDSNTMNKKVRNAQLAQFNFIFGKRNSDNKRVCTSLFQLAD